MKPDARITAELAEFLDSAGAASLALDRRDLRRLTQALLETLYKDLAKPPAECDGQEIEQAIAEFLPRRLRPRDPLAEHAPAVIDAYFAHLEQRQVVTQAFEIRMGLERAYPALQANVAAGDAGRVVERSAPVVHKAAKLGRNDPCFCGSGKKFKKCCGKPT